MQVKNEQQWVQVREQIKADGDVGQSFLDVAVFWAEAAEKMIEERDGDELSCYREAFALTQSEIGKIDDMYIGQIMVLHSAFWTHGNTVILALSPIELRFYENALAMREQRLQEMAAAAADDQAATDGY